MVARLLASLRAERVAALDLNPGSYSLTQRAESLPAGTVRDLLSRAPSGGHPGPGHPGPGAPSESAASPTPRPASR